MLSCCAAAAFCSPAPPRAAPHMMWRACCGAGNAATPPSVPPSVPRSDALFPSSLPLLPQGRHREFLFLARLLRGRDCHWRRHGSPAGCTPEAERRRRCARAQRRRRVGAAAHPHAAPGGTCHQPGRLSRAPQALGSGVCRSRSRRNRCHQSARGPQILSSLCTSATVIFALSGIGILPVAIHFCTAFPVGWYPSLILMLCLIQQHPAPDAMPPTRV